MGMYSAVLLCGRSLGHCFLILRTLPGSEMEYNIVRLMGYCESLSKYEIWGGINWANWLGVGIFRCLWKFFSSKKRLEDVVSHTQMD